MAGVDAILTVAPGAARRQRVRRALVADLFCGAGSLSMGANDALQELGYRAEFVAVNHWPVAIGTYLRNHIGARAHCVTLDAAFPAELVPEGRLDLLMAGIECTYFSRARGGKPVNDQQRTREIDLRPQAAAGGEDAGAHRGRHREIPLAGALHRRAAPALRCAGHRRAAADDHRRRHASRARAAVCALASLRWRSQGRRGAAAHGAGGGAHALIAPYYGSGSGETCRSVEDPLPTATAKARFGLVMPVTHSCDGNRARHVDEPLPTITTAKRGELAFITASFGERPTQAPRVHSVDDPAPTICATGRTNLVQGTREFDILFRMLEPHELAAAMSISEPERPYYFTGNKTEVVRQIGQAVPRRTGRALVMALMEG